MVYDGLNCLKDVCIQVVYSSGLRIDEDQSKINPVSPLVNDTDCELPWACSGEK